MHARTYTHGIFTTQLTYWCKRVHYQRGMLDHWTTECFFNKFLPRWQRCGLVPWPLLLGTWRQCKPRQTTGRGSSASLGTADIDVYQPLQPALGLNCRDMITQSQTSAYCCLCPISLLFRMHQRVFSRASSEIITGTFPVDTAVLCRMTNRPSHFRRAENCPNGRLDCLIMPFVWRIVRAFHW